MISARQHEHAPNALPPMTGCDRRWLTAEVRRALEAGEFELHYQPIRDSRTGLVAAFEALLRWQHPCCGIRAAAEFLPAIDGTEVMVELGERVLRDGCAQLARWQDRYGERAPMLALNVAARELRPAGYAERVLGRLVDSSVDPAGLCLELTDTQALEQESGALAELARLRAGGVKIALDDFGTEHASLRHLHHIAADLLKIDRCFVTDVGIDEGATAIVRAAIELAGVFGMRAVAEGVTTVEQHRTLLSMGCDLVQGFLIAPALPEDLADDLLAGDRVDPDRRVTVLEARGRLVDIDERYLPSEEEVVALAGVSAFAARRDLTSPTSSDGAPSSGPG